MSHKVEITYFKPSGKFYSEGDYTSEKEYLHEIWEEIEAMFDAGERPGLVDVQGYDPGLHALVMVPSHPNDHPHLIPLPSLSDLARAAHENSIEKGWWAGYRRRPEAPCDPELVLGAIPEKIALIHSEVSEALEDYRNDPKSCARPSVPDEKGKPCGFGSEVADVIIRSFDLAEALGLDIETEIKKKMAFNRTRPHRHGGKAI